MMCRKFGITKRLKKALYVDDVLVAMKAAYWVCTVCGVNPLAGRQWDISPMRLLLSFVAYVSLLAYFLNISLGVSCSLLCIYRYVLIATVLLSILTVILNVVAIASARSAAQTIISQLRYVDRQLLVRHGVKVRYSRIYVFDILFKFSVSVLHFFYLFAVLPAFHNGSFVSRFLYRTAEVLPLFSIYVATKPALILLDDIEIHFVALTKRFDGLSRNVFRDLRLKNLENLLDLYNRLCDICDLFNDVYCRQLLLAMPTMFLNILTTLFTFTGMWSYTAKHKKDRVAFELYYLTLSSALCLQLLWDIVRPCQRCTDKAKEFSSALYDLMIEDETKELANNDKVQLHLTMNREVKFTACGLFPIDNTLIHSMIAAATTYLVILVQFGPNYE